MTVPAEQRGQLGFGFGLGFGQLMDSAGGGPPLPPIVFIFDDEDGFTYVWIFDDPNGTTYRLIGERDGDY